MKPDKSTPKAKVPPATSLICFALAAATLAVYWPAIHNDFLNYDDTLYFTSNPRVLTGLTPGNMVWAFTTAHASNWHPVTWLSLMLDVQMFGKGPAGPHLTNLLLHAANTVLLFLLFQRLTAATWRSALVAALFALHPLHVESVAWVAERKDVLSAFFGLLSLYAYARFAQTTRGGRQEIGDKKRFTGASAAMSRRPGAPVLNSRRSTRDYALALVFFALALMSKPMLVTLPLVMLLLDWWPLKRIAGGGRQNAEAGERATFNLQLSTRLKEKWPFFALGAVSCLVTFVVQQKGGAVAALTRYPPSERLGNAFVSYARYLGKAFWPGGLATPYPHPGHWPWGVVSLAVALFAVVCFAAVWWAKRFPFAPVGWFWFVGMLVPVIGLVQVGDQSMADRYTYLPLIGVFIILVWGFDEARARGRVPKPAVIILTVLMLAACAGRARDQLGYWRDSETLFRHALDVTGNNYIAENDLGTWLASRGRIAEAMDCYRESLRIRPDNVNALYDLGNAFVRLRDWDNAIPNYRRALEITPNQPDFLVNLGFALAGKEEYPEAIASLEAALKLNPDSPGAHNNLGTVLFMQNRFAEAEQHFREALRLTPENPQLYANLGDTLIRLGRNAEAVKYYQQALQLNPGDNRTREKLRALGVP